MSSRATIVQPWLANNLDRNGSPGPFPSPQDRSSFLFSQPQPRCICRTEIATFLSSSPPSPCLILILQGLSSRIFQRLMKASKRTLSIPIHLGKSSSRRLGSPAPQRRLLSFHGSYTISLPSAGLMKGLLITVGLVSENRGNLRSSFSLLGGALKSE